VWAANNQKSGDSKILDGLGFYAIMPVLEIYNLLSVVP